MKLFLTGILVFTMIFIISCNDKNDEKESAGSDNENLHSDESIDNIGTSDTEKSDDAATQDENTENPEENPAGSDDSDKTESDAEIIPDNDGTPEPPVNCDLSTVHCVSMDTESKFYEFPTPKDAGAAAQDGDTVVIEADEYKNSGIVTTWSQNNLTIKGVNGLAHMNAEGVAISNGKAIWVIRGDNVTVENIEFSNAAVPDKNGAGIRYEGTGSLTVRKSYFHDNEMGILTGNKGTEDITLESCEFHDHGKSNGGFSHNIYIGEGAKFTMIYSYSHDAYEGHNVKSRADENYILYNRIFDLNEHSNDMPSSYLIDLPEGGLSYIIGNELHQSDKTPSNSTAISYGREQRDNPIQTLYFINNTIVNDRNNGIAISVGGTPNGAIVNNIFDNFSTIINGNFTGTQSSNEENATFVNRNSYDYRLQKGSNGINQGVNPGTGNDYDLTPTQEYIHPLNHKSRKDDGNLDVGAFEK